PGCGSSSLSFLFPEEFPAMHRRSAQARFTRAASWAIRSVIRSGLFSIIPISSSPASSAMARRKPDRSPLRGIRTSFSIRRPMAGTFRAHQVPLAVSSEAPPEHLEQLESWLNSYRPEELFDEQGRLKPELAELAPKGARRMGANPHANGGILLHDLRLPDFR